MKIGVIMAHSNTHDSRDRNIKFIVTRYQTLLPSAKITIVEQNTESDLSELNVSHILRKTQIHLIIVVDTDSTKEQK